MITILMDITLRQNWSVLYYLLPVCCSGTLLIYQFAVPCFLYLVSSSPPASCGGPALFPSGHYAIITTALGTPLCWRLTRCHRVLPLQVSYGLVGWVGVGIKYSKPFVCICKHTAGHAYAYGGAAQLR